MTSTTAIEWTDATWNPVVGCTQVSPGCDHCYAKRIHDRRHEAWQAGRYPNAPQQYHQPFAAVQIIWPRITDPLHWRKPRRVFVNSVSDLFHARVPARFIAAVFAVMGMAPQHRFQVLTKRPEKMHRLLTDPSFHEQVAGEARRIGNDLGAAGILTAAFPDAWPLPNVWLGVSVETQDYDWRIETLCQTPAAIRFVSCEPLLGPLDLWPYLHCEHDESTETADGLWECASCGSLRRWEEAPDGDVVKTDATSGRSSRGRYRLVRRGQLIDWVIVGGESGPGFRPVDPAWIQDLRDQCVSAGVPFFVKQDSSLQAGRQGRIPDDLWACKEFPDGTSRTEGATP